MAEPSIQTKYERLAQEYAKLRSNTTVLKKAVIDEKTLKAKLAEELKAAEMSQRKTKQELEALQFRNQQLAKRIEVLQDDLDKAHKAHSAAGKKKAHGGAKGRGAAAAAGAPDIDLPDQALIMEQLQKTIEENARLNSKLIESRESFEKEVRAIRDINNSAVENAKRELHQRSEEHSNVMAQFAMLQEEKRSLENQLIAKEAANQQLGCSIEELQKKLNAVQQRYDQFKLSVANSAAAPISTSSPAVEPAAVSTEPVLPLPSADALLPNLIEALSFARRFVRGMKEWHENHARRLKLPFGPLKSSPKLIDAISKATESAAKLEETIVVVDTEMKSATPKLTQKQIVDLHTNISLYGAALVDSLPLISQRIEDECALSFCPSSLSERNKEIITALTSLSSALSPLLPVLLQKASVPVGEQGPGPLWCCAQLLQQCKQLARLFNRKVSLEQSLAESSEELKAANEAMVHGLLVARTALEKLHGHLSAHAAFFSTSGFAVAREILCGAQASHAVTNGPCPVTSHEADALPRMRKEVVTLREQVRSLEQARDSLALEAQLERMRRGKESQRRCEAEKELQSFRSGSPSASSLLEEEPSGSPELASSEREALIQNYYQEIVNKQQQELHLLCGVAENFKAEFENVREQFLLSEKQNSELKDAVANLTQNSKSISEDLESTRRNYETQLSTLTEHIADMNEKLIQRQDCIEALKRQVESKENESGSRSASFSVVTNLFSNSAKRK